MRNKKIALIFLFVVLAAAIALGVKLLDGTEKKIFSRRDFDEYGFSIAYPLGYEDVKVEEDNTLEEITANITSSVKESNKDTNVSLTLVEKIVEAKSEDSGLTILVEAIKTDKTEKSLEEICRNYITMFKVFNENMTVLESDYEITEVAGVEAGKTTIYASRSSETTIYHGMISYLIPLEDREITIVFVGSKNLINNAQSEIDKIISSVKFYEMTASGSEEELSGDVIDFNEVIDKVNPSEENSGDE